VKSVYYCLVFEQNDFFKNQVIEELLRERANYYNSKNRNCDFWILLDPNFLNLNEIKKKLKLTNYWKVFDKKKNASVLVSSDIEFIKWIKLRIGFFEELNQPLLRKDLTSNGVSFSINFEPDQTSPLKHNFASLSPNILVEQFQSVVLS